MILPALYRYSFLLGVTLATYVAMLLFAGVIHAKKPPAPPPVYGPDLSLSADGWSTITGNNRLTLRNDTNGALYFDVPVNADTNCALKGRCASINYLYTTRTPRQISGALTVSLTVQVAGNPTFQYYTNTNNTCGDPATVRPFIWASNQSWADGDRWWSSVAYVLAPGSVTFTVPLDPALWSGVYGEWANQDAQTLAWWAEALANISSIGLTFGGGCFFGHGVYVTGGTARFTLQNYDVTP